MKDFATKYLKWYDGLGKVVKALLCLLWDIPTTLRRFSVSALKEDTIGMVLAVVLGLFGGWILFVIDLVCILALDKILWLNDLGVENITESLTKEENAEEKPEEKAEEKAEPEEKAEEPAKDPDSVE